MLLSDIGRTCTSSPLIWHRSRRSQLRGDDRASGEPCWNNRLSSWPPPPQARQLSSLSCRPLPWTGKRPSPPTCCAGIRRAYRGPPRQRPDCPRCWTTCPPSPTSSPLTWSRAVVQTRWRTLAGPSNWSASPKYKRTARTADRKAKICGFTHSLAFYHKTLSSNSSQPWNHGLIYVI